jgi:hypothetical protein
MEDTDGDPNAGDGAVEQKQSESTAASSEKKQPDQDCVSHAQIPDNKEKPRRRYLRELLDEGPDRHIELLLTIAIATFSCFQLIITCSNNANSSQQSERFLQSANRIDDAADSFSDSASKINGGIGQAVTKLQTQADKMDKARESSENNSTRALQSTIDNFRQEQRAWVGIGGIVCVDCTSKVGDMKRLDNGIPSATEVFHVTQLKSTITNTGRTPAIQTVVSVAWKLLPKNAPTPTWDSVKADHDELRKQIREKMPGWVRREADESVAEAERNFFPHTVIPPNDPRNLLLLDRTEWSKDRFQLPKEDQTIYVVGKITYYATGQRQQHLTTFCLMNPTWDPQGFGYCPTGNDME